MPKHSSGYSWLGLEALRPAARPLVYDNLIQIKKYSDTVYTKRVSCPNNTKKIINHIKEKLRQVLNPW